MTEQPTPEFGKRKPPALRTPAIPTAQPVKRSSHVALLLMGSLAVGGGAYALMPSENCAPAERGMAQTDVACPPRGSSSGGHGYWGNSSSRSSLFSGDNSASRSGGSSESGSGNVTRGGFGGFANAFAAHFSGGG